MLICLDTNILIGCFLALVVNALSKGALGLKFFEIVVYYHGWLVHGKGIMNNQAACVNSRHVYRDAHALMIATDISSLQITSITAIFFVDVTDIWNTISENIEVQMKSKKGVYIPNLGTFSFTLIRLDVGNNKHILIQRPVFVLSEKFAQLHGLDYTKYHTTGK